MLDFQRRKTKTIRLRGVAVGGDSPITVQSMTNTDTKDIPATAAQMQRLEAAGCDIIRAAINDAEDAAAIPKLREATSMPFVADIQFDARLAMMAIESGCDCLRINPGNIGGKDKVREIVAACKHKDIPIRIGVNSGSVHQKMIDAFGGVNKESMVHSALAQIEDLEALGFTQIKVAIKSSRVKDTVEACRLFSSLSDYPLHIGITEAGPATTGVIKSAVGLGTLLNEGIGDTLRVSLTSDPLDEVKAGLEILKACALRKQGIELISCPTCARTRIDLFKLVEQAEKELQNISIPLTVAIMGCAVNGPGEAKEADIGIAGGRGEGLLFAKGKILRKVPEEQLLSALLEEIQKLIGERNATQIV